MKKFALLAILLVCFSLVGIAQSGRKAEPPKPEPKKTVQTSEPEVLESKISAEGETIEGDVLRFDTNLVMVPVSVVDRYGRYVPQLKRENFKLFEDGVEQKITYFGTTDLPLTVVLVLDTSGSTEYRLEDIQNAAINFVTKLKPVDSVMVISFDDRIEILTKPTTDRDLITRAIRRSRTGGGTRLYDTVDQLFNKHLSTISGRKSVVLFTDGVDTTSRRASYDSTIKQAEESDAPIYVVDYDTSGGSSVFTQGLPLPRGRGTILGIPLPTPGGTGMPGGNPGDYRQAVAYLKALSNTTGGRFYSGDSLFGIGQAFTWIAEELGRQYSIGYYPKATGRSGQRRAIKVKTTEAELVVKARDSYIYSDKTGTQTPTTEKTPTEKQPYITRSLLAQ